ncbi:MAG: efflux RND transporter permease subunit [Paludibaculum sp.]
MFVPIAFMTGYAKRFLNQFGWTMSISIMVSMLVAFTLTPTLSARILKIKKHKKAGEQAHAPSFGHGPGERLCAASSTGHWAIAG